MEHLRDGGPEGIWRRRLARSVSSFTACGGLKTGGCGIGRSSPVPKCEGPGAPGVHPRSPSARDRGHPAFVPGPQVRGTGGTRRSSPVPKCEGPGAPGVRPRSPSARDRGHPAFVPGPQVRGTGGIGRSSPVPKCEGPGAPGSMEHLREGGPVGIRWRRLARLVSSFTGVWGLEDRG